MTDQPRVIDLSVEVPGTPEQVWTAIATGPGISSWFVPSTVEERAGGAFDQRFGPTPDMQVSGRVAEWDPPHRVLFDGGEGVEGLAFEWLVEAREGGTCVVRLVNSGFGSGEEWDAQYDGMSEGWPIFLRNLYLHLRHFPEQAATGLLPMAMWAGPREDAWRAVTSALGIPATPAPGSRISASADSPPLAGTVVDCKPARRLSLLLDSPAPGTAFLATEGAGDTVGVSVGLYLYGGDAATAAARDEPLWWEWLSARGVPQDAPAPADTSAPA